VSAAADAGRGSKRGRKPAQETRVNIPPFKGHERPAAETWEPKKGGWLSVPVLQFEALLSGGRLANLDQLRFIWEIIKSQWGSRGRDVPVRHWTDPRTDKEWIDIIGCSERHFGRVKFDALYRRLVEARRDGRSLRFSARIENWATAEKAPADLHVYDDERADGIIAPKGQLFWESCPVLEPGGSIAVPVFSCRRLHSDLNHSVSVNAEGGVLRLAAAAAATQDLAAPIDLSPIRETERQIEEFLSPYFIPRKLSVDDSLKRAIAEEISRTGSTFEHWKDFISEKLESDYEWRPGLILSGYMDDFRAFARQSQGTNGHSANGGRKTKLDRILDAGAALARGA
jgi:hypothetical protein